MWKKRVFLFLAGLSVILTAAFIICSKTVTEAPQPLPAPSPVPGPLDGITVCVDPGHGGYDGGAGRRHGPLGEADVAFRRRRSPLALLHGWPAAVRAEAGAGGRN